MDIGLEDWGYRFSSIPEFSTYGDYTTKEDKAKLDLKCPVCGHRTYVGIDPARMPSAEYFKKYPISEVIIQVTCQTCGHMWKQSILNQIRTFIPEPLLESMK